VLAARKVKSTGSAGSILVNVTVTGAVVPGVNAGIVTTAFVALTTVSDCKPVPALTWSTVTEPAPLDTPKEVIPPGNKSPSVTVVLGVQIPVWAWACVVASAAKNNIAVMLSIADKIFLLFIYLLLLIKLPFFEKWNYSTMSEKHCRK
jgi:hypothetical protein